MKNNKNVKRIPIVTVLLLVTICVIAAWIFLSTGSEVGAVEMQCPNCGGINVSIDSYDSSSHYYWCSRCVVTAGGLQAEAHSGASHSNGGTCETCGYEYLPHKQSSSKTYSSLGKRPALASKKRA